MEIGNLNVGAEAVHQSKLPGKFFWEQTGVFFPQKLAATDQFIKGIEMIGDEAIAKFVFWQNFLSPFIADTRRNCAHFLEMNKIRALGVGNSSVSAVKGGVEEVIDAVKESYAGVFEAVAFIVMFGGENGVFRTLLDLTVFDLAVTNGRDVVLGNSPVEKMDSIVNENASWIKDGLFFEVFVSGLKDDSVVFYVKHVGRIIPFLSSGGKF